MTHVLFAVSGSDHWTLADGSTHPCGFWPEELAVPHETFRRAGFDITVATPAGVIPVADEAGFSAAMNGGREEPGQRFRSYLADIAEELNSPQVLEDQDAADFDIIFIPGGHGPMEDLAASESFGDFVKDATAQGKVIAAVCHGPAALLPARDLAGDWLFAGRRITGFSNEEEAQVGFADRAPWLLENQLVGGGGLFERNPTPWASHVVVDGNLYTGQNPESSAPLAQQLVAQFDRAETPA